MTVRHILCGAVAAAAALAGAVSRGEAQGVGERATTRAGAAPPTTATHAAHPIPVPSATAERATGAITLDARLDEAAWAAATPVTEFRQHDPRDGEPATERTEIRFLFDDGALYIGAKMYDRLGRDGVTTTVVRRDNHFNSDFIELVIDSYHDHLSRAFFYINPSGSRQDLLGIGTSCCDSGWDPVWDAATAITDEGWVAEIRIPFNQLRFSGEVEQTWGLQIRRFIQRTNEYVAWSWWGRSESGGPNRFGHLEGITINKRPRNLEVLPYTMAKSEHVRGAPGDPFNTGSVRSGAVGLDLKYLLTSNLTLDATINPDFGQVEVDPAVVNLSAFETFFSERRPFFVSGSGVFGYGGFNCFFCSNVSSLQAFYSRRIGRAPTGADLARADGHHADIPEATSILGAAKITGRTANGYTIGVMNAVTGSARARVQRPDGSRFTQEVEPLANYFVGRLRKDYQQGNLVVGAIATSTIRDLPEEFEPRLSRHAELVGTDVRYAWKNRMYTLMANVAVSNVVGDPAVIRARHLSSARFYQRPDRGAGSGGFFDTRLDSTATSMRGYGAYARLAKEAGDWMFETAMNVRSPGFETNDYSFLTSADYIWNNVNIFRAWTRPTSWYRRLNVIAGTQVQRNFDGDITSNTQSHIFAGGQTPQFWNWSAFYIGRASGLIDDRLLRGGPSVRSVGTGYVQASVSTDSRKSWQLNANPSYSWNSAGGWGNNFNLSTTLRPSTRVMVSLGPSFSTSRGKLQYVRAVGDPTAEEFGGRRYVLSDIRQRQFALDTRLNVTFSPRMTLELYAQPFLASGRYFDFKEFDRPRGETWGVFGRDRGTVTPVTNEAGRVTGYAIDPDGAGPAASFGVGNPDFNFRSLRGNAVFRWEYRPGSTVYFAWTQQRSDVASIGSFDFGRDQAALFDARPDNIFLVKASWWLAR